MIECPCCGSEDIDLSTDPSGPVFECQECGEQFDAFPTAKQTDKTLPTAIWI